MGDHCNEGLKKFHTQYSSPDIQVSPFVPRYINSAASAGNCVSGTHPFSYGILPLITYL